MRVIQTKLDNRQYEAFTARCRDEGYGTIYECLRQIVLKYIGNDKYLDRLARLEKELKEIRGRHVVLEKKLGALQNLVAELVYSRRL